MKKFGLDSGDWVLLGTCDVRALLASNLVIRSPMAVNLVVGMTELTSSKVCCLPVAVDISGHRGR